MYFLFRLSCEVWYNDIVSEDDIGVDNDDDGDGNDGNGNDEDEDDDDSHW